MDLVRHRGDVLRNPNWMLVMGRKEPFWSLNEEDCVRTQVCSLLIEHTTQRF